MRSSAATLGIGLCGLIGALGLEFYPQLLAVLVCLASLTLIGWGMVAFPRWSARMQLRLPDVSKFESEQQAALIADLKMQGHLLPFGSARFLTIEVRAYNVALLVFAAAVVLGFAWAVGLNGPLLRPQNLDRYEGMAILYGTFGIALTLLITCWRWYAERSVLGSKMTMQYIVAGSNRTISFSYRDAQGEYFGSVARRRDRSWTPGELDLVMFDQQHPARAFTASSLMFHRIRFLPDAK